MIYTSPDYLMKYSDVLSEVIALAKLDKYADDFIEQSIADSQIFHSFESSNVTDIAFSTTMVIYRTIFPTSRSFDHDIPLFTPYYWIGEMYLFLFFKYRLTFETLFAYFPIQLMEKQYYLYHEMNRDHFDEYAKTVLKETPLSIQMKKKGVSAVELSKRTNIPLSTIHSLKIGRRDIKKLQSDYLERIAAILHIHPRSLFKGITLELDQKTPIF